MSSSGATIRLNSDLVLVPATVTDSRGKLIQDLAEGDFTLFEEGAQQEIQWLSRENAPVSLGIVFDVSGSMRNKLPTASAALSRFLDNVDPEDEEFLVTFADGAEVRLPFSSDPAAFRPAVARLTPHGDTALFDAIALAVREMRGARNQRKVLFVITDGGDNHSRMGEHELLRLLEEEDAQIHAIGIHDGMAGMEERRGPWVLESLAQATGGQHYMVRDAAELPALAARISRSLHDCYVLGYQPSPAGPSGQFRKIVVKVAPPSRGKRLSVFARRGYRMP